MRFPNSYIVYDTETTGLDPEKNEVIELSALVVLNGEPVDQKTWLIRASSPIPQLITNLTGITQDELDTFGKDPDLVWREFAEFVGLDKIEQAVPLIGHNIARFDNLFVNRAMRNVNQSPIAKFIDTAAIYKGLKMYAPPHPGESHEEYAERILTTKVFGLSYKLELVFKELGGDMAGIKAHRAAGDVRMTDFVYRRLSELAATAPVPAR